MTHEELEAAVPLYAAGALDRVERQALEAHLLSGCTSCHSALKDYQSVASLLPFSLSPTKPPRSLKAKIMTERNPAPIPAEPTANEPVRPSLEPGEWMNHLFPPVAPARSLSLPWALGIAALLIVTVGGYLTWTVSTQRSADTSNIKQLEASLREKTEKVPVCSGRSTNKPKSSTNCAMHCCNERTKRRRSRNNWPSAKRNWKRRVCN